MNVNLFIGKGGGNDMRIFDHWDISPFCHIWLRFVVLPGRVCGVEIEHLHGIKYKNYVDPLMLKSYS